MEMMLFEAQQFIDMIRQVDELVRETYAKHCGQLRSTPPGRGGKRVSRRTLGFQNDEEIDCANLLPCRGCRGGIRRVQAALRPEADR